MSPKRLTATGVVTDRPLRSFRVIVTGGSATAVVALRNNTDGSGTEEVTLKSPANDARQFYIQGGFSVALHATISGAGAEVYIDPD